MKKKHVGCKTKYMGYKMHLARISKINIWRSSNCFRTHCVSLCLQILHIPWLSRNTIENKILVEFSCCWQHSSTQIYDGSIDCADRWSLYMTSYLRKMMRRNLIEYRTRVFVRVWYQLLMSTWWIEYQS